MTAVEVIEELSRKYEIPVRNQDDPVDELVQTILSQNTSDINTSRAFNSLTTTFQNWDEVADAPAQAVINSIEHGGLANTKGPRIQEVLRIIREERGAIDLHFLSDLSTEDAADWMVSLPGVGPKTAACVLLFSLDQPVIPVDTHVFRVSKRLGLVPEQSNPQHAQQILEKQVPEPDRYAFHMLLIQHGREICKARSPLCERCVLSVVCPSSTIHGHQA